MTVLHIEPLPLCACGREAFAFRPGTEPQTAPDFFDAPLTAGDLPAAWCRECWPWRAIDTSQMVASE